MPLPRRDKSIPNCPEGTNENSPAFQRPTTETTAFRIIHGAAEDHPGTYIERWNDYLLLQSTGPAAALPAIPTGFQPRGIYLKRLNKDVSRAALEEAQPQLIEGSAAPDPFEISENGVHYEISFQQGYSVGLFLDQRDNRRRLLANYIGPNFTLFENGLAGRQVLNTFSYTCAFSVCAALAGARTTSLDLSKKYLKWGKRNFRLNHLDPDAHDFIFGDVFDWAPRLARKDRQFDLVILDPPTFSRSKTGGIFQAEKHYAKLVSTVLPLLAPGGILFASTNAHKLAPEDFLAQIRSACGTARRAILQEQFLPQPPDFPVSKAEPAYLKTVWLRVA